MIQASYNGSAISTVFRANIDLLIAEHYCVNIILVKFSPLFY